MLDIILHRESWHKRGGGWIGQAIYGANDGLGSVFGIVTGVAGATAGGPAVLIAGLAGMLASALSMGSGAYLATKTEREVQEAELRREHRELQTHPEEEEEELALFYQLKGVPEDEAKTLASRLIAQPRIRSQDFGQRGTGTYPSNHFQIRGWRHYLPCSQPLSEHSFRSFRFSSPADTEPSSLRLQSAHWLISSSARPRPL